MAKTVNLDIPHGAAEREQHRMKVDGIGRDPQNEQVLFLSLSRRPTDDEMRAIQDMLNQRYH